ncbi:MAG: hypothetical protein ABIJ97_11640 [Bacteroidota bacterium]
MTIEEYCDVINVDLIVTRFHNQNERWIALFEHCEVKDGIMLVGVCGNAHTPQEAVRDYIQQIKGKKIVFNSMGKDRREFIVPNSIEAFIGERNE